MNDGILISALRTPPELWADDPIQRYALYKEAAERIESLRRFIQNGVNYGYIPIPDEGDSAREIIYEVLK